MMLITGCVPTHSNNITWCSNILSYDKTEQNNILLDKNKLPESSIIRNKVLPDYERMRDEARTCHKINGNS